MRTREIRAARSWMIPIYLEFELARLVICESADDEHPILERSKRLQDRGRPPVHDDAVRNGEECKTRSPVGRRFGRLAEGRNHRIKERQRKSGSRCVQKCAAGNGFFENHHWRALLIWNGTLFTTPMIK